MSALLILGAVWLVCYVTIVGLTVAYFWEDDDTLGLCASSYREQLGTALVYSVLPGLLGPIGVLAIFCLTGFAERGWRLR